MGWGIFEIFYELGIPISRSIARVEQGEEKNSFWEVLCQGTSLLGSAFECIGPFGEPQGKLFGAKTRLLTNKLLRRTESMGL
jgi:hypothetical protein